MKFGNLVEICLWLHLAVKGLKMEKHEAPRLSTRKSAVLNCMEELTHSTFLLDGVWGIGGGGRGLRPYVGARV